MECGYARLTVFFEDPFWVGVYEREDGGRLEACRLVFGAEPRDYEVWTRFVEHWRELSFTAATAAEGRGAAQRNPKRARREAAKLLEQRGPGTKAQQALQRQREENKLARRAERRQRDEAEQARKFALRQQKKRARRRGHH